MAALFCVGAADDEARRLMGNFQRSIRHSTRDQTAWAKKA